MPKFVPLEDGSFRMELVAEDGNEADIAFSIQVVISLAKAIEKRPFDAAARASDRRGYWRYAEVERSLEQIRSHADNALKRINLADFPEAIEPAGTA